MWTKLDFSKAKHISVSIQFIAVNFGKYHFSLNEKWTILEKTNGLNLPCLICKTLFLYAPLFSCLSITWHCCSDLLRWLEALRSKNLKLKNACCPLSQIPRDLMLSLFSFVKLSVLMFIYLPVMGVDFGSILVWL